MPITADLYFSTADPVVVAFQISAAFADPSHGNRLLRSQLLTATRTREARFTEDDLVDLAAGYPIGTRMECAGTKYVINPEGTLVRADETADAHPAGGAE